MYDEKELLSIEGLLSICKLAKKIAVYALVIIWTIVVLGIFKYKSILAWSIIGVLFSLIDLGVTFYHCIIERCINNKRLEIRDDMIENLEEVHKHESEDYFVILKNAGRSVVLYCDYKEMKIQDRVYVFRYLNKNGKCISKDIYLQKKYKISPELNEFYIRGEEEEGILYE